MFLTLLSRSYKWLTLSFLTVGLGLLLVKPAQTSVLELPASAPTNPTIPTEVEDGFILLNHVFSPNTYLINRKGFVVHTWQTEYSGIASYLLENGHLLRAANINDPYFGLAGATGIVQEIAPDGTVMWEFVHSDPDYRLHHGIKPMPSGNILMIAWERKTREEAINAGRNPDQLIAAYDYELWPDYIIEVNPTTDEIVWEWRSWDHLIQDYDPAMDHYGVVADHPELIDINFEGIYTQDGSADWHHSNAIDYNADLDQIMLSVRGFSEIWIIDHSTTITEAAGHTGGNSGKGGDLLYRWGNPQAYDQGDASAQQLFVQHDAQWIPADYPGAGNITIFNNGQGRPGGDHSTIDEIVSPVDSTGHYTYTAGIPFDPEHPIWSYEADVPTDFYSRIMSGAQRLPNGNTLICEGVSGRVFEVTPDGEIVWSYQSSAMTFRTTFYPSDYAGLPEGIHDVLINLNYLPMLAQ